MTKPASTLTDAEILGLKTQATTLVADSPETKMAVSIVRTFGQKLTDEEWVQLYRGVTPDVVPLNPSQLEALRGGMVQPDCIPFPFPFPNPSDPLLL